MSKARTMATCMLVILAAGYTNRLFADDSTTNAVLGTRLWPAISNGMVFIKGEYIPPPYVVSRVESRIFLNGRFIDAPYSWRPPVKKKNADIPATDPVVPATITDRTTNFDKDFLSYYAEKRKFLFATYGEEKGIEMMLDMFRRLPCISAAEREGNSDIIVATWKSGEKSHIELIPPAAGVDECTQEQAIAFADKLTETYVQSLTNGHFYFLGDCRVTGCRSAYKSRVLALAEALQKHNNEEDFVSAIVTNDAFVGFSASNAKSFFNHRAGLTNWEPRVRLIVGALEEKHQKSPQVLISPRAK